MRCCWAWVFKPYLFVNLGELLKIVLKKGDFLFLCSAAPGVIRIHLSALRDKDNMMRSFNTIIQSFKSVTLTVILFMAETFFTLVAKSWTKSFLKLCRVCSSLALNGRRIESK